MKNAIAPSYKTMIFKCGLILYSLFLLACASDVEKRERRENAFDVSGSYKTLKSPETEIDMGFDIQNESGRHDIVIKLDRKNGMTEKERQFIKNLGLDADTIYSQFSSPLILGKGYNSNHLDGGENISSDFGDTSDFNVCTPIVKHSETYSFSYCLIGHVVKKSRILSGQLILSSIKTKKEMVDGKETPVTTLSSVSLSYKCDMNLVFFQQYFGSWSGEVFSLKNDFDPKYFSQIQIKKDPSAFYVVQTSSTAPITFRGDVYNFDRTLSLTKIESLSEPDYPAVQSVFKGPHNRRIVLFGQIWSLGNFTGTVTLIDGEIQTDLATFRLKKDNR